MLSLEPLIVIDLFPTLERKLLELLNSLTSTEWQKPTICPQWTVKDIVAHLLDGNLRRLSMERDAYFGETPQNINSSRELVDFLNRLNADWIQATKRLSPQVLSHLIEITSQAVYQHLKELDLHQPATFPVAWAGEEHSLRWFDIAREYTERWHHQQQIRVAVEKPGITGKELYAPVLETFMRALPYTYRQVSAREDTLLTFHIVGEAGGTWHLLRKETSWRLVRDGLTTAHSEVLIPQDIAWRIFTKGIDKTLAEQQTTIRGDVELGRGILNMLSVMA